MKKLFGVKIVLGIWLLLLLAYPVIAGDNSTYADPKTRDLVAFVEAAAAAVRNEGEKVFPDFRGEGGSWFQDDRYIFVWDLQGNRYVYPPDVEHERGNFLDLKDVGGKPIGKMIVDAAVKGDGKGWVHYQWTRPHELEPQWKSTYIVKAVAPSGKEYLIGSGIYGAGMEKTFIIEEVEAASALMQREGKGAFVTLRDPKSRFFFHDTYMFVMTMAGVELVNPAFPALEGRNLWDIQDMNGKYIVQEFIDLALKEGAGWVTYYWPRPGAPQMPVKKESFVKKVMVGDEAMIIGAGMYE